MDRNGMDRGQWIGVIGLVIVGLVLAAAMIRHEAREYVKWQQGLSDSDRAHIAKVHRQLQSAKKGDLLLFYHRGKVALLCKTDPVVYSDSPTTIRYTTHVGACRKKARTDDRWLSSTQRVVHRDDSSYERLAAQFINQ
jgi:hypothetical protein